MKKSTLERFKESAPLNAVLQIHKWRKKFGKCAGMVTLESSDPHCSYFLW